MLHSFSTNGIGTRIIYKLKTNDCCYIVYRNNVDHYLSILLHDQPEFILGIGACSDINQDCISIKTICTNYFENSDELSPQTLSMLPNSFLESSSELKHTSDTGNSLSNLISWKITQLINNNSLKSKYTFLYIPKSISSYHVVKIIEDMLKNKLQKV